MRYIALLGQANTHAAAARAAQASRILSRASSSWQVVCSAPGMSVICRDVDSRRKCVYTTHGGGIVLGKLFRSACDDEVATSETLEVRDAAELARHYWGRYVGFDADASGGHRVFRDPTAALPCFFARRHGLTIVFANLADYHALFPAPLSVNWYHLSKFLCVDRTISADTGFVELAQVLGGECITLRENATSRAFFWSPAEVYERGVIDDLDAATAQLADTTRRCIRSWGGCYDKVLHQLSGGLDSAIVLSCLPADRTEVLCLNSRTETLESNEAKLARLAARMHGRELIEVNDSWTSRPLETMLLASEIASPAQAIAQAESELLRQRLIAEQGVQALFTGQGGDHLFQRRRDPVVASEFIELHGLDPKVLTLIAQNARMTNHSVWAVARACVQHGIFHRHWEPYPTLRSTALLTDAGVALLADGTLDHPWLSEAGRLPIAKRKQLYDVIDCQTLHAIGHQPADLVHPLISQPLIECTLRIPTYILSLGGIDRGLARQAFAEELPAQIFERQTKGRYTSFWQNLVCENLSFVREMLLDGELVRGGVLSRTKAEAALSGAALLRGTHLLPLIQAVFAEAWIAAAVTNA
jgi:asparagine synthase (glutamine-hydrolysing)